MLRVIGNFCNDDPVVMHSTNEEEKEVVVVRFQKGIIYLEKLRDS